MATRLAAALWGLTLLLLAAGVAPAGAATATWSHARKGKDWPGTCKTGLRQSPIDIVRSQAVPAPNLKGLRFSYEPQNKLMVENKGYTFELGTKGGKLTLPDFFKGSDTPLELSLAQIHFHATSEHKVNGKRHALEAHFVHLAGEGAAKRAAVVGVFFEIDKDNKDNEALNQILNVAPLREGKNEVEFQQPFNLESFLPADRAYYYYPGSLTTPTCDEIVSWFVMAKELKVSKSQMKRIHRMFKFGSKGAASNTYRDVQPLNARQVLYSDGQL